MMRMVVARLIVAILLGLAVGYAVGKNTEADVARGNALTMKTYIADFDHYKQQLVASRVPMAAALVVGLPGARCVRHRPALLARVRSTCTELRRGLLRAERRL